MLEDLYRRQPDRCVPSDEIVRRSEQAGLSQEARCYFSRERLDDDCYSRGELADQLNRWIADQGQQDQIGRVS